MIFRKVGVSLKRRYIVPTATNNTIDSCVLAEQACIYSVHSVHDVDHKVDLVQRVIRSRLPARKYTGAFKILNQARGSIKVM